LRDFEQALAEEGDAIFPVLMAGGAE